MAETQKHQPEIGSQQAFTEFVATHPSKERGRHRAAEERRTWRERAGGMRRLGGHALESARNFKDRALYGRSVKESVDADLKAHEQAVAEGQTLSQFVVPKERLTYPNGVITAPRGDVQDEANPWFATREDHETGRVATHVNGEEFGRIVDHADDLEATGVEADAAPTEIAVNDLDLPEPQVVHVRRGPSRSADFIRRRLYTGRHGAKKEKVER